MNRAININLVIFFILFTNFNADNWPRFLGPHGTNTSNENNLPVEWGEEKNLKWKTKIPGKGWSSPIVWGDKIFVTTALRAEDNTLDSTQVSAPTNRVLPTRDYKFEVYCLNKNTGEVIWQDVAHLGKPGIITHIDNTYASETPVSDGTHLYVYFGMTGLYCYDLNGKKIWEKHLGSYPMEADWGTSSSPILYKDMVILQFDNTENSQVIALDKNTGEEKWRTKRNEISTWSTPYIWQNKIRAELVTGGKKTRSYNPETGELIWELDMRGGRDITSPVGNEEMIFLCNEERSDGGGTLFAVKAGAKGDISLNDEQNSNDWVAWMLPKSGIAMATPVLYKGYIYIVERRRGVVSCVNAETGQFTFRREKLEGAKEFWASPWAYNDMIFCLDDTGTTHVIKAGPDFEIIATNKLDDRFWSSTAIAGRSLIFRGVNYIYGIGE